MSKSNVVGRKHMSCINHIFLLNGIIHDTIKPCHNTNIWWRKDDWIYVPRWSCVWFVWFVNSIWHTGPFSDANQKINVRVKAPSELGVEFFFERVVLQGDTWGHIMASDQVDTLGKQLLEEEPNFIYKYKRHVPLRILGMVDNMGWS